MSLESSEATLAEPLVCEASCSPSHRRARLFLTGVVFVLMAAINCLAIYCLWSSRA